MPGPGTKGQLYRYARVVLLATLVAGCGERVDPEATARETWLRAMSEDAGAGLRSVLNGNENVRFYSGWYTLEADSKSGNAWRWTGRKGILQLRTKPDHYPRAIDMQVEIFGWVPFDDSGLKTFHMEFSVNGHILDRYEPESSKLFSRKVFVPHQLLDHADWVDFVVNVSSTVQPVGDWRHLGFATTGLFWTPAPPR